MPKKHAIVGNGKIFVKIEGVEREVFFADHLNKKPNGHWTVAFFNDDGTFTEGFCKDSDFVYR